MVNRKLPRLLTVPPFRHLPSSDYLARREIRSTSSYAGIRRCRPRRSPSYCRPPIYRNRQQPSGATSDRFDIRRLVVNRQFYDEAASIFYSTTLFYFSNNWALSQFLRTAPPRHLSEIRRLKLHSCDTTADVAEWKEMIWSPLVKQLSGLRYLYIDVFFLGFSTDLDSLMSLSGGIEEETVEDKDWPPSAAFPLLSRATLRLKYSAPKNAPMSARAYAANACQDLLKYLN